MLAGYIDDSGSEKSAPNFVLAGYVLPAEAWENFSDDWSKALTSGKPIAHLHMMDLGRHAKDSQFEGWSLEEKEDKLLSLAEVIVSHKPFGLAAHAKWSDFSLFQKQSSRRKFVQSPYKALLHEITRIMFAAGQKWNNGRSVHFVFDKQGKVGEEAISWYSDLKAMFPPDTQRFFGGTPRFADDELVLPLQAADMLAWFLRRRLSKPVIRPAFLRIEEMITEHFSVGSEVDVNGFEKAAFQFEKVARSHDEL